MENNQLAALQAKRNELKKAIKDKQKAMDYFDVSDYYDEEMFFDEMHEAFGYIDIMGIQYSAVHTLRKIDYIAFSEMYNNHINTLDKSDFEKYKELEEELEELEEELEELENELLDIEDQIENE